MCIRDRGGPFSAGADIEELSALDTAQAYARGWLKDLSDTVQGMHKPIIAAVEGFALGGGFELALLVYTHFLLDVLFSVLLILHSIIVANVS